MGLPLDQRQGLGVSLSRRAQGVFFLPYFVAADKGIVRAWLRGIADEGLLEVLLTGAL